MIEKDLRHLTGIFFKCDICKLIVTLLRKCDKINCLAYKNNQCLII